ncbi:MAG: DUF2905 domain-containing protein [Candidatus Dadabacteria bacterium]|nr:MAG: DUF2905 domain-containing protein [Candidatus Dadabacteria bacterium]
MGRLLIVAGVLMVLVGLLIEFGGRFWPLPGDIVIERRHVTVFFPVVTCLVVSLLLTILLNLLQR